MSLSRLIMPSLWLSSAFLATLVSLVNAQQVVLFPASLPSCISTCTTIQTAETGCVPPAAPVTSTAIYTSCFCQSALLTSLTASAANVCPGICSDGDWATIYNWYKGFCNVAGVPTPVTPTTTNPDGAAATSAGSSPSSSTNDPSWISTHYNWVIMLIVLVVGLILVAIIGSWLHRRHRRRREEAENAGPRPDLQTWGPNQGSVHDLGITPAADSFGGTAEKGKGKERAGEMTRESGSKRLTKGIR